MNSYFLLLLFVISRYLLLGLLRRYMHICDNRFPCESITCYSLNFVEIFVAFQLFRHNEQSRLLDVRLMSGLSKIDSDCGAWPSSEGMFYVVKELLCGVFCWFVVSHT